MQYKLNKKVIVIDVLVISLAITGITLAAFAAPWIYSNILNITGSPAPQVYAITLSSNATQSPVEGEPFKLVAVVTLNGSPKPSQNLTFWEDDIVIGWALSDGSGIAFFNWQIQVGSHNYKAGFELV